MKILNINIFYGEGSTGKIVEEIHVRLKRDGYESYVVYGLSNKKSVTSDHTYKMTSNFLARQYGRIARITGLRFNTAYLETFFLINYIKKINPDIVHLHCLNCSYINPFILIKWLGQNNYKVLVTHHADITLTANCDHAFDCEKWKTGCDKHCKAFKKQFRALFLSNSRYSWMQMKHSFSYVKRMYASGVSRWMSERVKLSPFFKNIECRTIENGINTEIFSYSEENRLNLRHEKNLVDAKIVLYVTPSFYMKIKGGEYIIELAKKMPSVRFYVVGIRNGEKISNLPSNIIQVPYLYSQEELRNYYCFADVTVLTSYRESFSLVVAESLSCGTPVVGFKAGAPETIALNQYSSFVDFGDVDSLKQNLEHFLDCKWDKEEISKQACERYSSDSMYRNYLAYYKYIYNRD